MAWGLGNAMHKQQAFECARLIDFEFRLRARTMRLLADELNMPPATLVGEIALRLDAAILARLVAHCSVSASEIEAAYHRLQRVARATLVRKSGTPRRTA